MLLEDLFKKLSHGELSNLSLANDGSGSIRETDHAKITQYINEGLTRLYARFLIKERTLFIAPVEYITFYHIDPKYCQSRAGTSTEPVLYIMDTVDEPYEDDLLKILSVYESTHNRELPLNDVENYRSVFTPQNKVLQVPEPKIGTLLEIHYQAKHLPISYLDMHSEIVLPDVLEEALRSYVAHKVFSHMNTADATNKAREHEANYEKSCNFVIEHDLVSTSVVQTNTRFARRGWK